ncbi:hypothetical protein EJ04DRAFT_514281 [Polyplosphaeria fusca]|uniref:Uncharacterized protein n=1 Tax=Polyplosphaeria fusca TaxID=682080 RepID=A0A9P4UZ01_9PLEO|nr:hypothetical protein EJ04DRAFT_514281 [Polyplosphaeria fusca]
MISLRCFDIIFPRPAAPSMLLTLPLELRLHIYSYLLPTRAYKAYRGLRMACRQTHDEIDHEIVRDIAGFTKELEASWPNHPLKPAMAYDFTPIRIKTPATFLETRRLEVTLLRSHVDRDYTGFIMTGGITDIAYEGRHRKFPATLLESLVPNFQVITLVIVNDHHEPIDGICQLAVWWLCRGVCSHIIDSQKEQRPDSDLREVQVHWKSPMSIKDFELRQLERRFAISERHPEGVIIEHDKDDVCGIKSVTMRSQMSRSHKHHQMHHYTRRSGFWHRMFQFS